MLLSHVLVYLYLLFRTRVEEGLESYRGAMIMKA